MSFLTTPILNLCRKIEMEYLFPGSQEKGRCSTPQVNQCMSFRGSLQLAYYWGGQKHSDVLIILDGTSMLRKLPDKWKL